MTDLRVSTEANPIPCPVRSPGGLRCTKLIHRGWTVDEGHGGGHFWVSDQLNAIFDGGHYDATAALSGQPFDGHKPEDCPGSECRYRQWVNR